MYTTDCYYNEPADITEYRVVDSTTGRNICLAWSEEDARRIERLLCDEPHPGRIRSISVSRLSRDQRDRLAESIRGRAAVEEGVLLVNAIGSEDTSSTRFLRGRTVSGRLVQIDGDGPWSFGADFGPAGSLEFARDVLSDLINAGITVDDIEVAGTGEGPFERLPLTVDEASAMIAGQTMRAHMQATARRSALRGEIS